MKLITRDTDYAVRALCVIAKEDKKVMSVDELVKRTKISRPFLRKILQILSRKGIISSYKGRGGGFKLLMRPEKINLSELINIFQGEIKLVDHIFKNKPCPRTRTCSLKKITDDIEKDVILKLNAVNMRSLL